ncbi:DUF2306 domain-containing protein [Fodinibius sp. Rm-B-1B1-1]|uniref:DUF2306 domain-containing protein n=1 Tax=Fodinibius alkaliphilus TaxID=3140241 RepID=UPI00315A9E92
MILTIHTLSGVIAIITGAWNLVSQKGTQQHRLVGWIYIGSFTMLLLTSFGIYEMFGGFGPFHIMSIVSTVTLGLAIYFPLRREHYEGWIEHHYFWILYSYIGLLMATGSHLSRYGPSGWPFWARILLYWGVPLVIGSALIFRKKTQILERYQASQTSESAV